MAAVNFRSGNSSLHITGKTVLKSLLVKLFKQEKVPLQSLDYIFCTDEFLLQMNRNFLQHDYYTDIITFGLSEKGAPVEAELYISTDRVKDNAAQLGVSYQNEIARVIIHGALHLCGYRDKKKSEIVEMRGKEDQYLRLFKKMLLHA
jgi:rRNA maturation RNase YbeY